MQPVAFNTASSGTIFDLLRMNVRRPPSVLVYFTSLTKASANNNGKPELRPQEPTGGALKNGPDHDRSKSRDKANCSFGLSQPLGMN